MQKHADVVQNLNGNVVVGAVVQVMVAGTSTPATIFADAAGLEPINSLTTDSLGEFGFYAPNGRYDLYIITNGVRVAHDTDVLLYDPEDDTRVTSGGSGGGGGGGGGSGGGSGNGMTVEVDLVPASDGTLTPDYSQGNNFHVLMTGNVKMMNPVNYPSGVDITLTFEQDSTGGRLLSFDTKYAMPDALPIVLATAPGGINLMKMHQTSAGGGLWLTESTPDKTILSGYSPVTAIARIGSVTYFGMSEALGAAHDGDTVVVLRSGKSHEVTGTLVGPDPAQTFRIYGAPVQSAGADKRPLLQLFNYDFGNGPPRGANRPAFGKALLNFEGKGTVYVRDLRLTGARNDDSDARGLCPNADAITMIVNNVEITDCNNGILSGNVGMVGNIELYDVLIDKCGIGGPTSDPTHGYSTVGFTHSVYFGHNNASVKMQRCSLTNAVQGNNLKCRTGTLILDQVLCSGSAQGRELEMPNGGYLIATNCSFIKPSSSNNGSMVLVGGNGGAQDTTEGLDTSRQRKYKFVNCLFHSDYSVTGAYAGRDGYLVCNLDPSVQLEFVDCKFEGELASSNANDPNNQAIYAGTVTQNGIRYMPSAPPIYTYTGGPVGPLLPVGYQPIPMTPIA